MTDNFFCNFCNQNMGLQERTTRGRDGGEVVEETSLDVGLSRRTTRSHDSLI